MHNGLICLHMDKNDTIKQKFSHSDTRNHRLFKYERETSEIFYTIYTEPNEF